MVFVCNGSMISMISPSDGPQLSGSEEVAVEVETELVLWCDVRANPPVQSVSWKFNGTKVDLEAMGMLETTDGFNTKLSNGRVVKSLHEGTYECSANHAIYGLSTKTFHVKVTGQFTQSSFRRPALCAKWPVVNTLADESPSPLSSFVDKIFKFPLYPMITGLVVVFLTIVLAVVARWQRIVKVTHNTLKAQRLTLTHPN